MSDFHFYEPTQGHGLAHDPLKAIVAPRPIGWISSISPAGVVNLAPYSFFNGFVTRPFVIGFCSEGWKDSVANIQASGEFVFNLTTARHAKQMNITSSHVPSDTNEMELAGLKAAPSKMVKPPRVADAPAALECRVTQIVRLRDMNGNELDNYLTMGQVVGVHIERACIIDGKFDMTVARTIARCGYADEYVEVKELFRMSRPG